MKKSVIFLAAAVFCFIVSLSIVFVTKSKREVQNDIPVKQITETILKQENASSAHALFVGNLPLGDNGQPLYPDEYGGEYIDNNGNLIIQFTTDDFSEYEYIKNEYPCVQFKQVDYSTNYLDKIIDDFILSYDSEDETFYCAYVDVKNNCAVIEVDEKTFESKSTEKNSLPIEYRIGSPNYLL